MPDVDAKVELAVFEAGDPRGRQTEDREELESPLPSLNQERTLQKAHSGGPLPMDSVEPFGSGFRQPHHPDGDRLQTDRLVAPDNVADHIFLDRVWFDDC